MNDQIGFNHLGSALPVDRHAVTAIDGGDRPCLGPEPNVHAKRARAGSEAVHQIRIEFDERSCTAIDDGHAYAGACGNVRKLERHIAAADENDRRWQRGQVQKLIARGDMFAALECEIRGTGARRDDDRTRGVERRIAHAEVSRTDEARAFLKRGNPRSSQLRFERLRTRVGEGPFESDQLGPVDREGFRPHTLPRKETSGVDGGRSADQDLLRVAASQRARAAERTFVDHRNRPTGGTAPRCDILRGRTGADHDEIERLGHLSSRFVATIANRLIYD